VYSGITQIDSTKHNVKEGESLVIQLNIRLT